jgi:hypothetical protein
MHSVSVAVFALGLLIVPCVSADAATVHRSHTRPHSSTSLNARATAPAAPGAAGRFAVPGWSGRDTERWLDNASSLVGVGG